MDGEHLFDDHNLPSSDQFAVGKQFNRFSKASFKLNHGSTTKPENLFDSHLRNTKYGRNVDAYAISSLIFQLIRISYICIFVRQFFHFPVDQANYTPNLD